MAATTESIHRSPFAADHFASSIHKSIPILPSSSASPRLPSSDPMDVTPTAPTATMGPPSLSSPVAERQTANGDSEATITTNGASTPAVGAAAAAQQPKVVQTAFIHKLYNMLEDQSIQHLISWSSTNESFVMQPSTEFSKVLSSYFKHTNISSFVRQLNMYGFHKVSDVFHTGQPDAPLWEFRHGNGNFKRGDLIGLREIKRRASRHALIHRDSFSTGPGPKPSVSQVGTSVEPMPEPLDARLSMLEHQYYDMQNRLVRSEDTSAFLNTKCTFLSEGLMRCHQWNLDLATYVMAIVPNQDDPIHKDVSIMQREIARQTEMFRNLDDTPEPLSSSSTSRQQYFSNLQDNGPPLSPRQMPANDMRDQRRPSQPSILMESRPFRTPHAPHLSISPRRYGSIGSNNSNTYSPSSARTLGHPPPPPPPPMQHPLATVSSPPMNLSRRHTSADIRLHGWPSHSPYASGHNSTQWPSSPHRGPLGGDEHIRNTLAQYELPRGPSQHGSRQPSPPPPMGGDPSSQRDDIPPGSGWQLPGPKFSFRGIDSSAPPTRRSSMASNVHSLLNPAGAGDDDDGDPEGRKRKRIQ